MQMTKKVLSVVLAVLMVVSMMSVMAVSAGAATYDGVADGYYVLSEDNSWTPGTALALNTAYTGAGSEYMGVIDTTANAQYKIAYIENGEANFWAPAGPNATFDGDYTGKSIIYFKTSDNSWSFKKGTVETEDELKLAASVGGSWKLLNDVATTSTTTVSKDMTLDFNGKKIVCSNDDAVTVSSGKTLNLTNTGSDTGYLYTTRKGAWYGIFNVGGTVNVGSGVQVGYENESTGGIYNKGGVTNVNGGTVYGTGGEAAAIVVARTGAKAVVNSGNVTASNGYAISGNGSAGEEGYVIEVKGGTVSSANDVAIYHPNTGTLSISGGTVSGTTAVYTKAGTTAISGGTLTATGDKTAFEHNGNGCTATGDAVVVEACDYPGTVPAVTISGGTFNTKAGEGAYQLGAYTYRAADEVTVTVDGTTLATAYGDDNATFTFANDGAITNIATDDDYKVVVKDNGDKEVVAKEYVAQIGTAKFESLEDAFANADSDDTITVLADTTLANVNVSSGKTLTLDCADKTVTVTPWSFTNAGTLTVTGTTGGLTGEKGLVDNYGTLNIAGGVHSTSLTNPAFYNNYDGNVINVTGGTINAAGTAIVNENGTTNVSAGTINGAVLAIEDSTGNNAAADAITFTGGTINSLVAINDADCTFTMSGNAAINYEGDANGKGNALEVIAGTANLNGGTITGENEVCGVFIIGDDSVLNINGATITTDESFCISSNGTAGNEGYDITINSGTFTSQTAPAVYQQQEGTLTINGGTFSGSEGVYIKAGTVVINGGSFTGTDDHEDYVYNGGGTSTLGDAIVVDICGYPGGVPDVTIKGGTFAVTGDDTNALGVYTYNDNTAPVAIDGATIPTAYGAEDAQFTFANGGAITTLAVDDDCKVVVDETTGAKTVVPKDYVCQVGDTKYETFVEARNAIRDSQSKTGTIKLLQDITLDGYYGLNGNFTLDLNGKTITGYDERIAMFQVANADSSLTIVGPGTLQCADGMEAIRSYGTCTIGDDVEVNCNADSDYAIYNYGTLNVEDGATVKNTCATGNGGAIITFANSEVNVEGTVESGQYGVVVIGDQATVNVKDGAEITVTGDCACISGNGSGASEAGYVINVEGGTLSAPNGNGIYHPNAGTLTVTGGTITGATGIYVKSGTSNLATSGTSISGATVIGTGAAALEYTPSGNGANPTGDAIVIDNCGYPGGTPAISISGGTFISENAQAVGSYNTPKAGDATTEAPITNFISGGTFSTVVPDDYCANGFIPVTEADPTTGLYTVTQGAYVAEINGTKYESLKDAVAAAQDGDTIVLLDDYDIANEEGNPWIVIDGKELTIDLDGNTLSSPDSVFVVKNGADVTVENGAMESTVNNDYAIYCYGNGSKFTLADDASLDLTAASGNGGAAVVQTGGVMDIKGTVTSNKYGVYTAGGGTVNVYDGASITTTGDDYACVSGNGSTGQEDYTMNIMGGTLTAADGVAIYHPNQGTLNITGGALSGETAIYIKSGTSSISGGTSISGATITGTGQATAYSATGDGFNPTGDAIVIDNCGYPGGTPDIRIEGGTITSVNGDDVASYKTGNYERVTGFISGGSFSQPVPDDLCESGYEPAPADQTGRYGVQDSDNPLDKLEKDDTNKVITAAAAQALDLNEFQLPGRLEYKVASILGVQKKSKIATDVAGEGLRFVAEIDTETAKTCDDYGFLFTKVSGDNISTAAFGQERFDLMTIENVDTTCSKFSCKGRTCTVVDGDYGDPVNNDARYTYVTGAVTGVTEGKGVAAVFYVTIGGNTYYANYTGTEYYGICSPDPSKLS